MIVVLVDVLRGTANGDPVQLARCVVAVNDVRSSCAAGCKEVCPTIRDGVGVCGSAVGQIKDLGDPERLSFFGAVQSDGVRRGCGSCKRRNADACDQHDRNEE